MWKPSYPFLAALGTSLLILSACGRPVASQAVAESPAKSEEITSFVEEVSTPPDTLDEIGSIVFTSKEAGRFQEGAGTSLAAPIVNLGALVWDVVKSNKPSNTTSSQYANALPSSAVSAMDLEGFSELQTKSYRIYGTNPYNATVYDVTYTLVHRYGGSFNGNGQYLENVTIIPSNVKVLWGYTFNMEVKAFNPINAGTKANPIGEINLDMKYSVSTILKSVEKHLLFVFRGNSATVTFANSLSSQIAQN